MTGIQATTRYVVLLRGINVNPSTHVAMGELRAIVIGLGYAGVRTLLQSGNVIVDSPRRPDAAELESAILSGTGVRSRVVVLGATILICGVLSGLIPAWQSSRGNVNEALKQGGRSGTASGGTLRVRSLLIAGEMAAAFLLLEEAHILGLSARSDEGADDCVEFVAVLDPQRVRTVPGIVDKVGTDAQKIDDLCTISTK